MDLLLQWVATSGSPTPQKLDAILLLLQSQTGHQLPTLASLLAQPTDTDAVDAANAADAAGVATAKTRASGGGGEAAEVLISLISAVIRRALGVISEIKISEVAVSRSVEAPSQSPSILAQPGGISGWVPLDETDAADAVQRAVELAVAAGRPPPRPLLKCCQVDARWMLPGRDPVGIWDGSG